MFCSLKAVTKLYKLFSQDSIATKIVGILSLAKPDFHGDISNDRANLKNFLINVLTYQHGCMKLNDDVCILLIDTSDDMIDVCLSVEMNNEFYHVVEDETLEIIEGIYNNVIINLGDELKLQNFFTDKEYHSNDQIGRIDDNKDYIELKEKLARANDYITTLTEEKSDLIEKHHEIQGKMILQLKEIQRELKEEKKKNELFHIFYDPQAQTPIDSPRQPNHHATTPRNKMNRIKLTPIKSAVKLPILQSLLEDGGFTPRYVPFV